MLPTISSAALLVIAFSCSSKKTKDMCHPSLEEQGKSFYIRAVNDSVALIKSGAINNTNWTDFLSKQNLLSSAKIIDCPTGKEINPRYWSYDISYRNKRLVVRAHKDLQAYHDGKKEWIGPLGVPTYAEEIYAANNVIGKTTPVIILHPPYYSKEAMARLNEEFEKNRRENNPYTNYLLQNRLLGAALNGDTVSRSRLLHYRSIFQNESTTDHLIEENIELLKDYEEWLANGGKRIFLTSQEFPLLK
jgi:hypothetical protein